MLISGLQKLTLLDYPGTVACTVFTGGCNFRCPFCHNASLVLPQRIEQHIEPQQLLDFLNKRRGVLEGVAITGGEPLLHKDMPQLLKQIKELGYKIKLDTNGSFPELLKEIVKEQLVDRVAMDIKNSPELYGKTIGVEPDMSAIEQSKDFLLQGLVDYEFRTTAVKGLHSEESIRQAARWIQGAKEYYIQQFKDSGDILSIQGLGAFDEAEMNSLVQAAAEFVPAVRARGI